MHTRRPGESQGSQPCRNESAYGCFKKHPPRTFYFLNPTLNPEPETPSPASLIWEHPSAEDPECPKSEESLTGKTLVV